MARYGLSADEWRRSTGEGSKGPRVYDWAFVRLAVPVATGFEQALLICPPFDAPNDPKKLAHYLTFAMAGTPFETLLAVAGRRWTLEESFAAATGEMGLDHYEAVTITAGIATSLWPMLALAYLAVVRVRLPGAAGKKGELMVELGVLIPLTVPQVRRLLCRLVARILAPPAAILHWSRWCRLHQARTQRAHYRRRQARS